MLSITVWKLPEDMVWAFYAISFIFHSSSAVSSMAELGSQGTESNGNLP
jgi:hypothetical protein